MQRNKTEFETDSDISQFNPVVGHRASQPATEYCLSVFTQLQNVNNRDV